MQQSTQTSENFTVRNIFTWIIKLLHKTSCDYLSTLSCRHMQATLLLLVTYQQRWSVVLQVLASVCISLIEKYALTLCAHILSQIIVSINSLWPHFTEYTKFIISWQFAGWQKGERRKKCKHKTVREGIGTWQSVKAIYHSVKLHWLLQQNYLQCKNLHPKPKMAECWREYRQQIELSM